MRPAGQRTLVCRCDLAPYDKPSNGRRIEVESQCRIATALIAPNLARKWGSFFYEPKTTTGPRPPTGKERWTSGVINA